VDTGLLAGYPEASAFWDAHPALAQPPQPRPDTADRPLRVAVVTLCDGAMEPLCAASVDNKRAYAERHGTRLRHASCPVQLLTRAALHGASLGYTLVVANEQIDPSRPAAWSKILAVARALRSHDLVLCVDADALIMNPTLRAEELMDWRAQQTLAADHNGPNSGVWLIRDSPWSRWFVGALWEQEHLVALPPLRQLFHYEQRAFHHLLQTAAWRRVVGLRYEHANAVRASTSLVHQCVLNSLPSWYRTGDFVLHLAGVKGAAKCLLFRRAYGNAAAAAGRTPGADAAPAPSVWRCLTGSTPVAAKR
jgi:hypothetical protein